MSLFQSARSFVSAKRQGMVPLAALAFALSTAGCATIISGEKQALKITSVPESADITITTEGGLGVFVGKTPAVIELPRRRFYKVVAEVPGYLPATVRIDQELNGWFCGNILCGGVVGVVIDYATGAMWNLDPDTLVIMLVRASEPPEAPSGETMVLLLRAKDDRGEVRETALPLIPSGA